MTLAGLAGCATRHAGYSTAGLIQSPHYYPPPGPPEDPWGPYITQAAARFGVPEAWIRAVMRQESGGQQQAVSSAGALGLMQLMPETYAEMRDANGLGNDPFQPRDNIFAGTAYLKLMYDQFGAPGFLAAYNAGPQRLQDYLSDGTPLPDETVNYVAALAPQLGNQVALTGPLAAYAHEDQVASVPNARSFAAGCDADLAYDPARPCHALERAATVAAPAPVESEVAEAAPVVMAPIPNPAPEREPEAEPQSASRAAPEVLPLPRPAAGWGIQVGAFLSPALARAQAERARHEVPELLQDAALSLPVTAPFGGKVLYRARLTDLPEIRAQLACQRLNAVQLPCLVVRPHAA